MTDETADRPTTGATGPENEGTDHLVVGIDGSEESAVALRWAVDQARRRGCSIKLVYALLIPVVSDAYGMVMTRPDVDELASYSKSLLTAAEEVVRGLDPDLAVRSTLREGPPAAVLVDESKTALGLVVGTRGLGSISGKMLGSVSVRVATKAACPVYVIPPEWNPIACAGDPVVVGVDGSDHSEAALRLAIEECKLCTSPLKAVIAYHVGRFSKPTEPGLIAEYDESERAMARKTVEHSLERAGLTVGGRAVDGAPRVEIEVVEGKPAPALVEAGRGALITVLGSRGRGGIARALLGSVSRSVMLETARPLAVVHAKRDPDHS